MNGAEQLVATALARGVDICFANPGTTEVPLVLALDAVPGMRPVLCLHENVATGAADGYGRMTGRPAMCLLHLGPGLANGLTNLHNAKRAATPVLVVIGEHASWHIKADPLLATDIEALAGTVSRHVARVRSRDTIAAEVEAAIAATYADGGGIATLIVPHDIQLAEGVAIGSGSPSVQSIARSPLRPEAVLSAAQALKAGSGALLLGGAALSEQGLARASRISAATGVELICDTFFARMERGVNMPRAHKLPYFPDQALQLTRRFDRVVVAGTRRPVGFFGYPDGESYLTSDEQTVMLAGPQEDAMGALDALAGALGEPHGKMKISKSSAPALPRGALDAHSVSAVIAGLQPEGCIVMDEALTVGVPYFEASQASARFTHLMLTGGAIGEGPGAAAGAAMGAPDRKVINYQSDGCGAYSVQALWTEAREKLDVLTIIGSNRSYNILNVEMQRAGQAVVGAAAWAMTGLDRPYLDWVKIAEGFGVPAVAVDTAESLAGAIERALEARGPRLIEAIMA